MTLLASDDFFVVSDDFFVASDEFFFTSCIVLVDGFSRLVMIH